jgi:hypothetical protein
VLAGWPSVLDRTLGALDALEHDSPVSMGTSALDLTICMLKCTTFRISQIL